MMTAVQTRRVAWLVAMASLAAMGSFSERSCCAEHAAESPAVLGRQACVDCHDLSVEAWQRSSHSRRSLEMVSTNLRAARYAARLGLAAEQVTHDARCVSCHGTFQQATHDHTSVLGGVSCESCHGPAGPTSTSVGWLALHSGEESPPGGDDADLAAVLKDLGMARTDDLYLLAVRCHQCHSVAEEQVVNAGHVAGTEGFEMVSWFAGEVRHNFAPYTIDCADDEQNAIGSTVWLARHQGARPRDRQRLMFVAGQLADLEVNLRNRAKATEEGAFALAAASRTAAALSQVRQISGRLNDATLAALVKGITHVRPLLFLPPQPGHQATLEEAADEVSRAARRFLAEQAGADLAAIEPLIPRGVQGTSYQP